jgi:ABC-type multidrug transport system, permease component
MPVSISPLLHVFIRPRKWKLLS